MNATIHGKNFEVQPEPADYWGWVRDGLYDHEWKVYDKHLRPEHTFVDLGAWVGSHSLYASSITQLVLAAEPDPVAYEILKGNIAGIDGLLSWHGAVMGYQGKVRLGSGCLGASTTRRNPNAGGGIGAWEAEQTCEVPCMPLRDLVRTAPNPLFIKMDIEGSEEEVLEDSAFFSERKPTLLIELHPWWWHDEAKTYRDFEQLKALYRNSQPVNGNTWILWN